MKRKALSLMLVLLMAFSLLPASAFAANVVQSGNCAENLSWTLDDEGVLTITGTGEMSEIPPFVQVHWTLHKDSIRSVVIGSGVASICDYAFSDCVNLTEVSIPNSVTKIGRSAFKGCTSLEEVVVPGSVATIEADAFSGCKGLKRIDLSNGIRVIESSAFRSCTGLTSVELPNGIEVLGGDAFNGCKGLKSVVIQNGVTRINGWTFSGCSSLESVSIPSSVKFIGCSAFVSCGALRDVYFGGTDMQWDSMEIEGDNEALDSATIHFAQAYPFTDIAGSGYRNYILLGYMEGIINGYPDGTFRPNNKVTRAQYITMLYNMCGRPDVITPGLLFKDTGSISDSYLSAVKWGVVNGIIKGYDDNTFRPDQQITRAQMAAFSYRLMKLAVGGEFKDEVKADCHFKDSSKIAKDYKEAVNVMANLGIITGFDTNGDGKGDTFRPNATANRGQAATIIVRVAISLGIVS